MTATLFESSSLLLDAMRVTEAAALVSAPWVGRGDGEAADAAATNAMRSTLQQLPYASRIVIGEGERDAAPMLYIGEELGNPQGLAIDIAVDPLEGTNLCATASAGSLTVLALTKRGHLLHAPDVYMQKIAVGGGLPEGIISLQKSVQENLHSVARAKGKSVAEMTVIVLDRPRHSDLIAQLRGAGARVQLITDGDVAAIIQTALPNSAIDMVMGSGGAPEGVLAAAALRCLGGQMQGKLLFESQAQIERATTMGISNPDKIYNVHELVTGDAVFVATGVTSGTILQGIEQHPTHVTTHSLLLDSASKRMLNIHTRHFTT